MNLQKRDGIIIKFDLERNQLIEKIDKLTEENADIIKKQNDTTRQADYTREAHKAQKNNFENYKMLNERLTGDMDKQNYSLEFEKKLKHSYHDELKKSKQTLNQISEAKTTYVALIKKEQNWGSELSLVSSIRDHYPKGSFLLNVCPEKHETKITSVTVSKSPYIRKPGFYAFIQDKYSLYLAKHNKLHPADVFKENQEEGRCFKYKALNYISKKILEFYIRNNFSYY